MKRKNLLYKLNLIVLAIIIPLCLNAQPKKHKQKTSFWDNWSLNLNLGLASYYGDLSYYDDNFMEKLSNESGMAYGGTLTKTFFGWLGLGGQLLYGSFKGGDNKNTSFETKLFEYNAHLKIDIIRLAFPRSMQNFGLYGKAGIGQFRFSTTTYQFIDGQTESETQDTGVPEFVYFAGGGISYDISNRVGFNAEISIHQPQNDNMDNLKKNDDYDYFTHLSIGITYYFSGKPKSKAGQTSRLAHTGIRSGR